MQLLYGFDATKNVRYHYQQVWDLIIVTDEENLSNGESSYPMYSSHNKHKLPEQPLLPVPLLNTGTGTWQTGTRSGYIIYLLFSVPHILCLRCTLKSRTKYAYLLLSQKHILVVQCGLRLRASLHTQKRYLIRQSIFIVVKLISLRTNFRFIFRPSYSQIV